MNTKTEFNHSKWPLRILLSPIIFLWGVFMLAAGTLFPVTFIVIMGLCGLISTPFTALFNYSGSEIEYQEPFIDLPIPGVLGIMIAHLAGTTIHFWGAFAVAWIYIYTGEVFTGE